MVVSVIYRADGRRTELADREGHRAEKLAGSVVCSLNAFLFGNAVFRSVNEILCRTLDPYYREESESHNKLVAFCVAEVTVHRAANVLGNILAKTAALDLRGAYHL